MCGLAWASSPLSAAPTGTVEPRRPSPVTGKVVSDAPAAAAVNPVAPRTVSTAVQVPAPAHLPAAPFDLQAQPDATAPARPPSTAVGRSPAPVRISDVSRETQPRVTAKSARSEPVRLRQRGSASAPVKAGEPSQHAGQRDARRSAKLAAVPLSTKAPVPAEKSTRRGMAHKLEPKAQPASKRQAASRSAHLAAAQPQIAKPDRAVKAVKAVKGTKAVQASGVAAAATRPAALEHAKRSTKQASRAHAHPAKARSVHQAAHHTAKGPKVAKAVAVEGKGAGRTVQHRPHARGA